MRYMGGKVRIGKDIAQIIKHYHKPGQVYYEPFVGGLGLFQNIPAEWVRVINDIDADLMTLWQAVTMGYEPPRSVSKDEYNAVKSNLSLMDHKPYERAFISYFCSFGGKKWGGYAAGEGRNYALENCNGISKVKTNLSHAFMFNTFYDQLPYLPNSLIYCDPPYKSTTTYKGTVFDSDKFYNWCNIMANDGHTVIVSEYNSVPATWVRVWSKHKKTTLNINKDTINLRDDCLYLVA